MRLMILSWRRAGNPLRRRACRRGDTRIFHKTLARASARADCTARRPVFECALRRPPATVGRSLCREIPARAPRARSASSRRARKCGRCRSPDRRKIIKYAQRMRQFRQILPQIPAPEQILPRGSPSLLSAWTRIPSPKTRAAPRARRRRSPRRLYRAGQPFSSAVSDGAGQPFSSAVSDGAGQPFSSAVSDEIWQTFLSFGARVSSCGGGSVGSKRNFIGDLRRRYSMFCRSMVATAL